MSGISDELRTLIREIIRDVLPAAPNGLPVTETVNLSTDEDLAAFVTRLLDLDPETRADLRAGRKRFRLAVPPNSQTPAVMLPPSVPVPTAASGSLAAAGANGVTAVNGPADPLTRRVERGAVTEKVVRDAARAGQRLVLGPGAVLTPLARDRARASGVKIIRER